MKKFLVVYNPASGRRGKKDACLGIRRYLTAENYSLTIHDLQKHSLDTVYTLTDYEGIIVIGGDGTLRTVVQYLKDHQLDIAIALIPRGSANLLARSLSVPFSLQGAAQMIKNDVTTSIDVARLKTGEYFVGAFAMGYLSHRVTSANQRLKNIFGFGGYLWSFLVNPRLPLYHFSFNVDGKEYEIKGHSLFIVNASNLFGIHSKRVKDFRDGQFELAVATNKNWLTTNLLVYDFYIRHKAPKHFFLARGHEFTINTETISSLQIDGEAISTRPTTTITVLKKQQTFFIP